MQYYLTNSVRVSIFLALLFLVSPLVIASPDSDQPSQPGFYALYCWAGNYIEYSDDIQKNGISWVRMGGFEGDSTDQAVLLAAKNNVHIAPTLFMRDLSHNQTMPVDQAVAKFGQQVRQAVTRYGPGGSLWKENPDVKPLPIKYWEIWNEPNIEFITPPDDTILRTEIYAKLLLAASKEIRAFDPSAKIVAFNVAGGNPYHGRGVPPDGMYKKLKYIGWRKFISDVVAITGTDCFDIVGTHPYTSPHSPEDGEVVQGLDMISEIAQKQGFADKPVWFTEVGFATVYPRNRNVRDERQQACFITRLFAIAASRNVQQIQIMYITDIVYGPDGTLRSFGFYPAPGKWQQQAKATQIMLRLIPDPRINPQILSEKPGGQWAYKFRGPNDETIIMAWNAGDGTITGTFDSGTR